MARLSHPNVVVVYDVGTFGDAVFIAMEFVEGNTSATGCRRPNADLARGARGLLAAGRGLAAAHAAGLVHRDFKPDNVMVTKSGQVRVMDFGLAREQRATTRRDRRQRTRGGRRAGGSDGRHRRCGRRPATRPPSWAADAAPTGTSSVGQVPAT